MTYQAFHICNFSSTDDLKGQHVTYENIKACVVQAGRFSAFETRKAPGLFTRLHQDPDLIVGGMEYPWVGVKIKGGDDDR